MILRRIVLGLVLVLFTCVTVGVILGLDDNTRSQLVGRLPGRVATVATPSATPTPTPTPTATPEPRLPPTLTPTPTAIPGRTPRPTATPAPTAKPTPWTTPKPRAKPKPTLRPTPPKKGGTESNSSAAKKKAAAKKAAAARRKAADAARYLHGPLRKGTGGTVYLTFDDGPSPFTSQVLDVLVRTRSTATFFHLGVNEAGYPYADAGIRAQGSNVGNHSYDHPDLTKLHAAELRWQLRHGPHARCFRPPYGATDRAVRTAIGHAGMRQVLWSVDTLDWTRPGVARLAKTGRLKVIRNGSIILMHDGGGDRSQTVAALPRIIADLHARGFQVRALPYC